MAPAMPAMFFSCAEDKALCMAIVPKDVVNGKGFKASDWCKEVQALIDGKVLFNSIIIRLISTISIIDVHGYVITSNYDYCQAISGMGELCFCFIHPA